MYGWDLDYIRYRLSFAQAITMLDTRNERERKAREAAEEQEKKNDPNYVDLAKYKTDRPVEELPSIDDVKAAFGMMMQ